MHSRIYLFYNSKSSNVNESHWAALSSFRNIASFLTGCALDARSADGAQGRAFDPCRWSTFKRGFTGSPGTCLCTCHVRTQPRCAFRFEQRGLCTAESIFCTFQNHQILINHTRPHPLLFNNCFFFRRVALLMGAELMKRIDGLSIHADVLYLDIYGLMSPEN